MKKKSWTKSKGLRCKNVMLRKDVKSLKKDRNRKRRSEGKKICDDDNKIDTIDKTTGAWDIV